MARKPTGYVIYHGPSLIDGKPIVAIAITESSNPKTANMVQTYILRQDVDPREANRTGQDFSICGTCPHRGTPREGVPTGLAANRTCYVRIDQGPLTVWKGFVRGIYPNARGHAATAALGKGRMVRLGTYGDPAAVPSFVWDSLLVDAEGHTAYSHQAGQAGAAFNASLMMRSADSELEARTAWAAGQRTFRIIKDTSDMVRGSEILCPASEEAGKRTICERCGLCAGASIAAKSIAIVVHGSGRNNFV